MIGIVDYGLGNVQAISNIYSRLNIPAMAVRTPDELRRADRLILPGVGSFDWAMRKLNDSGMRPSLEDVVLAQRKPILGICVGFQMMANSSEEGLLAGLGWINAVVRRFAGDAVGGRTLLPQMGWNDVVPARAESMFADIELPMRFYFLHSYYFEPAQQEDVLATTDYNGTYCSAARHGNVFGVQFHPEKSHKWGIDLLRNFAEIA